MARIAIADGMAPAAIQLLTNAGHEVVNQPIKASELLDGALSNFDAIVVRSATKLPAEVIAATSDRLKVIGRAGVGVDNLSLIHI